MISVEQANAVSFLKTKELVKMYRAKDIRETVESVISELSKRRKYGLEPTTYFVAEQDGDLVGEVLSNFGFQVLTDDEGVYLVSLK